MSSKDSKHVTACSSWLSDAVAPFVFSSVAPFPFLFPFVAPFAVTSVARLAFTSIVPFPCIFVGSSDDARHGTSGCLYLRGLGGRCRNVSRKFLFRLRFFAPRVGQEFDALRTSIPSPSNEGPL